MGVVTVRVQSGGTASFEDILQPASTGNWNTAFFPQSVRVLVRINVLHATWHLESIIR
jgi:hypothetical protein